MAATRGLILTAALSLGLGLSACSGDDSSSANDGPGKPGATSTSTATGNPFATSLGSTDEPSGTDDPSATDDPSETGDPSATDPTATPTSTPSDDVVAEAAVEATLRQFFLLSQQGKGVQACALQTEAYTAYDEKDGDKDGGCVEEVTAYAKTLKKQGRTLNDPIFMNISVSDTTAIVTFKFSWWKDPADYYLTRQDDDTWKLSGDNTSGPL